MLTSHTCVDALFHRRTGYRLGGVTSPSAHVQKDTDNIVGKRGTAIVET